MDFGEKREVGREILSLSNLLYRKIEYDKKKVEFMISSMSRAGL